MTWSSYFTLDALNFSRLKHMDDSPKHYKYALDHPEPETDAMVIGRYVHAAVFEPDTLDQEFAIWTGARRAGKDWDTFKAEAADRSILRASDLIDATAMVAAVRAHPDVRALLDAPGALFEHTLTWTDEATGLRCKARPDLLVPRILADLKTTRSIDVRRFGHDVARFQYHAQLAHYSAGVEAVYGWKPEKHILIVVEKSPPYDVAVFPVEADAILTGASKLREWLDTVAACQESGEWPGRYPNPIPLGAANLPPWIFGGGVSEFAFEEPT